MEASLRPPGAEEPEEALGEGPPLPRGNLQVPRSATKIFAHLRQPIERGFVTSGIQAAIVELVLPEVLTEAVVIMLLLLGYNMFTAKCLH